MQRRSVLKACAALLALAVAAPLRALAAVWNAPAFEAKHLDGAQQGLGVSASEPSAQIELIAPQLAENGAVVQIEVLSRIPGTEAIAILVEKNPTPLIANFMFSHGAEPYVITRIKMAETSLLKAVVKAGGNYYEASKLVEVSDSGCD
jgi:sulfur-oxidizing protein SoxY